MSIRTAIEAHHKAVGMRNITWGRMMAACDALMGAAEDLEQEGMDAEAKHVAGAAKALSEAVQGLERLSFKPQGGGDAAA